MSALAATFADFKLIKTRKTVQLVFEIPMEKAKEALDLLGMPNPHEEQWVGIALLEGEPKAENQYYVAEPARELPPDAGAHNQPPIKRKSWGELSRAQQAGVLCGDIGFQHYVRACMSSEANIDPGKIDAEAAAVWIRRICGVVSRKELDSDIDAGQQWEMVVRNYRQWMAGVRAIGT